MSYYLDLGGWGGVFAVPNSLVDKHLKLANENQIKILLWVLRHGGEIFTAEAAGAAAGISPAAAEEALEYWLRLGVLGNSGNNLCQGQERVAAAEPATAPAQPEKKPEAGISRRMLRPDGVYIAKRIGEDRGVAAMMSEAEAILGKTVSPALAAVLVIAHDDLSLPPEVVTTIITYAKSVGKTGTAYIEALTRNWAEGGVFTLAEANKKLEDLSERSRAWRLVSRLLGIPTRAATKKEEEFSYSWVCELKVSEELITEAYERSVNTTGKIQMKYMDTCIRNWLGQGIFTASDIAEQEEKQRAERKELHTPSYDMKDIESFNVFTDWKDI